MEFFVLLGLLLVGGYVLGIVGFFRANRAHAELRDLRATLAGFMDARAAGPDVRTPDARTFGTSTPPSPMTERLTPEILVSAPAISGAAPQPVLFEQPPPIPPQAPAPLGTGSSLPGAPPPPARPPVDLEALLTARWGVWLGSAALLLSGVFLIRYAVEESLLGPGARCALAALSGASLLAGAEWLLRHSPPSLPGPLRADQTPGALAAGGTAVLFGALYGAGPFYDLLPPMLAFAAMAAASLIGLAAALRHGQVTAATGIAGALVTPALVVTDHPSIAGLFVYLLTVSAAALAVVRYTAWTWLGWVTAGAGAVWVCIAAGLPGPELWAAAALGPAAAALDLFLLPPAALDHPIGRRLGWIPFAVLGLSGLVLEPGLTADVPVVAVFLLSPLAVWRGLTEPRLDRLPWVAALLGLLGLLIWQLPPWGPTGETLTVEGIVEAVFPGAWAPDVIRPLIGAAAIFAAFHALAGLYGERRAVHPLHWTALTGAVPVLTLAVAYDQVGRFQSDGMWAGVAVALSALLTLTAGRASLEGGVQRAGIHAAGAVAALALGVALLLHDQWLSLAIALFLPPLAWIEARADLPPLRKVALVVTGLVLVRLVLNWYVLDYGFGARPIVNGLIAAYAAPALALALAARMFRRRADDLLVAVLEGGAVTLAAIFVALELRHGYGGGALEGDPGFPEAALHLLTLSVQAAAYLVLAQRTGRAMLDWAWRLLGALALGLGCLLLFANPMVTDVHADIVSLLAAYAAPAALAVFARSRLDTKPLHRLLGAYALIGFGWITLQVRQTFHPDEGMGVFFRTPSDAELWAWSGAWLAYGIGLMILGIRLRDRGLRLAALAVVGLVCAKVFLVDMSDLTGLWRVLSFLGLGLALIGLGAVHRRFVAPAQNNGGGGAPADAPDIPRDISPADAGTAAP